MSRQIFPFLAGFLASALSPAWSAPDIAVDKSADGPVYFLTDKAASNSRQLLWNSKEARSDLGYSAEGGVVPEFFWSSEREFLAVNGGNEKERQIFLYRLAKGKVSPVEVVPFTRAQSAPLRKLKSGLAANGVEALRWTADGNLLIHVWAQERVTDEKQKPGSANFWAELAIQDGKAIPVSVADSEPEKQAASEESGDQLDPKEIEGTHDCHGSNPDGSTYDGSITIRCKQGLVFMEWDIGGKKSHGTGLLEGMTLGVALDDGVAIYQVSPQDDGYALVGRWASEGAEEANDEVILTGKAERKKSKLPAPKINGTYSWLRVSGDTKNEGSAEISGGTACKTVSWTVGKKSIPGQGLALGDGLAVIRPDGLAVYQIQPGEESRPALEGHSVRESEKISTESLTPEGR